jgi:glycolate dehydrogenase FAD-linked subunit
VHTALRRITSPSELDGLSRDAGLEVMLPAAAVEASTEEDVVQAMRESESKGLSVTPRGGGTAIPSQSVGRGTVIVQQGGSLSMSERLVAGGPGVVKDDLNRFLALRGLWVPVDPSSHASCTIGGMVANNSSGARTLKYGSTVRYVSGVDAVFPGGGVTRLSGRAQDDRQEREPRAMKVASLLLDNRRTIEAERPRVTKNSSGYRLESCISGGSVDLAKLFVGSEGTLGVATRVVLEALPRPTWRVLLTFETSLGDLDGLTGILRTLGPSALELVDKSVFEKVGREKLIAPYEKSEEPYMIFCEFDGEVGSPEDAVVRVSESGASGYEPRVMTDPADIQRAWDVRSDTLTVARDIRDGSKVLAPGVEDLVVPPEKLGDMITLITGQFERRGLEHIIYGHAGDANLHARPLMDVAGRAGRESLRELMLDCFERVWKLGGSMTGEHGDGRLRAEFVERQYPRTYWIMQEIKELYDPKGMMNPGVKISSRRPP